MSNQSGSRTLRFFAGVDEQGVLLLDGLGFVALAIDSKIRPRVGIEDEVSLALSLSSLVR